MRASGMIRVIAWSFIAVLALAALSSGIRGTSLSFSFLSDIAWVDDIKSVVRGDQPVQSSAGSVPASGIHDIAVDWVAGAVDIRFYDGNTVEIRETASRELKENEALYYTKSDDKLTVQYRKNMRTSTTSMPEKRLELLIPRSMRIDKLRVKGVSSQITIDGADQKADTLDIETVSGDIAVEMLSAKELTVNTVSGAVRLSGAYGGIRMGGVSASWNLRLSALPESMRGESISGSFHVFLPENDGFSATLDSISGSLSCNFGEMDGRKSVRYKSGGPKFRFEELSGNVTIEMDKALYAQSAPTAPSTLGIPDAPDMPDAASPNGITSVPSSGRGF